MRQTAERDDAQRSAWHNVLLPAEHQLFHGGRAYGQTLGPLVWTTFKIARVNVQIYIDLHPKSNHI